MTKAAHITTRRFLLRISSMGRQLSDLHWQTVEPHAALQLQILTDIINKQIIEHNGVSYNFSLDLSPVSDSYLLHHAKMLAFEKTKDWDIWRGSGLDHTDCFIECKIRNTDDDRPGIDCAHIVEYLLYEVFVVMNIVAPGTFNFDGASFVHIPERRTVRGSVVTFDMNKSASVLENYLYRIDDISWLQDIEVSSKEAFNWLRRVAPLFTVVGDNPANKCILAMLHICKGDAYSGAGAAWLFNGLEALLQCGPGENRATLTRRIGSILNLDEQAMPALKKIITELYNIRSSFVHGGIATIHPVRDETLDNRVDQEILRLMAAMDKGITLLIAIFRKIIALGIDWPTFEEVLVGKS